MLYPKLKFPRISGRPFFYTNFVTTLDGKVWVKNGRYWPIGSRMDYCLLIELRAYADCLIHGKNLYNRFGEVTKQSLQKTPFKALRKKLGKDPNLPYLLAEHNLKDMPGDLYKKGYGCVLVEGGPTLLGSFLKEGLLDEIFITIAPKIYGSKPGKTLTLVEGFLFPKKSIKKLRLISVKPIGNEVFLRYSVEN